MSLPTEYIERAIHHLREALTNCSSQEFKTAIHIRTALSYLAAPADVRPVSEEEERWWKKQVEGQV